MENFNKVYKEYYSKVFNYVLSRINYDKSIAEEITDDVFIKISEHLSEYDKDKSKLSTWIYFITNNKIIDYYRSKGKKMTVNVSDYVNDNGEPSFQYVSDNKTDDSLIKKNIKDSVKRAMSKLNEKEQKIAVLYFIEEMKYFEIAQILDIPMGTVKGLISRIRGKLQKSLSKTYVTLY